MRHSLNVMRLKYTQEATADLVDVLDHIALDSPKRALSYVSKLREAIELLQLFPNMGVACKTKGINEDCRVMTYESYLIFYVVMVDTVLIKTIINASRDYT